MDRALTRLRFALRSPLPVMLVLSVLATGCATAIVDPRVLMVSEARALDPMEGFVAYAGDARIRVEPGAEAYASRVAALLDGAIARVEAAHYQRFKAPVEIYVCGSEDCFKRHVLTPRLSAAVIPDNRLLLSPNLNARESWRLEALLVHELSHLHLGQRVGHYHANIPVWFHEGWASLTADGGGAEFATDVQAVEAARNGKRIDPAKRDAPGMRHKAGAFDLNIHLFYRQAMLLVKSLKERDPARFRQLALALQADQDFEIAFWDVYGTSPAVFLADAFDPERSDNRAGAPAMIPSP